LRNIELCGDGMFLDLTKTIKNKQDAEFERLIFSRCAGLQWFLLPQFEKTSNTGACKTGARGFYNCSSSSRAVSVQPRIAKLEWTCTSHRLRHHPPFSLRGVHVTQQIGEHFFINPFLGH